MADLKTVGSNIKRVRKAKGKKQQEVASAAGIPLRTFQGYERGENEAGIKSMIAIADALDVSLDELAGIERPAPEERKRAGYEEGAATLPLLNHDERPVLEAGEYLGFAFKAGDTEQLTIDFVVRGRTDRLPIEFTKRE